MYIWVLLCRVSTAHFSIRNKHRDQIVFSCSDPTLQIKPSIGHILQADVRHGFYIVAPTVAAPPPPARLVRMRLIEHRQRREYIGTHTTAPIAQRMVSISAASASPAYPCAPVVLHIDAV